MSADTSKQTEVATLAGGCFWCLETVFERLRGVERVESGYIAINGFGIGGSGPFGGVKNSGMGRECGVEGFESFLEYISYPVPAGFADELAKTVSVG